MTEKEILEGNKLIAEFIGKTIYPEKVPAKNKRGWKWSYKWNGEHCDYSVNALQYHSSWDWLMPVVEKIEKDNDYIFEISKDYISVFRFSDRSGLVLKENTFTHGMGKIHAVYLAVIKLINIHNENKQL